MLTATYMYCTVAIKTHCCNENPLWQTNRDKTSHCCNENALWQTNHTVVMKTHCGKQITLLQWKCTVAIKSHCCDENALWQTNHTVGMKTHCGKQIALVQWKRTVANKPHCCDENALWQTDRTVAMELKRHLLTAEEHWLTCQTLFWQMAFLRWTLNRRPFGEMAFGKRLRQRSLELPSKSTLLLCRLWINARKRDWEKRGEICG
jgi:hypothetical protein